MLTPSHPALFRRNILQPLLVLALSLTLAWSNANSASEPALEELRREIDALNARVQRLENELSEGVAVNPARSVKPHPGGWQNAKNWNLLANGMEKARVREILGMPQDTKTISKFELWYYGKGKVKFYLRRLKSFDKP